VTDDRDWTPEADERLKELIRGAESPVGSGPDEPDVETLLAYLEGRLDPERVEAVQKALIRSPELREELLILEAIRDPEAAERLASVPSPPAPPRPVPTSWFRRHRVLWSSGAAGLAAAAAIAVVLLRTPGPPFLGPEAWERGSTLRPEQFDRDPTRGSLDDLRARDRDQAETLAFLRLLERRNGEIVVHPEGSPLPFGSHRLVVLLRGRGTPETVEFLVPAGAESLRAAYLSLPDLRTFRVPFASDTLRIERPRDSNRGAITISFIASGYPGAGPALSVPRP